MTTVSIYYNIKDLFKEDEWTSIEEEYSCELCFELIYKHEWYQCIEGHQSCKNCWNKIILDIGSKQCPQCKSSVSFKKGLSRCRKTEQKFSNKKISCPYSFNENITNCRKSNELTKDDKENACIDIITIEQLDHHQKNCNSRFVRCENSDCGKISRYLQHLQHENECNHAIIQCELCDLEIKRMSLTEHQDVCPSKVIKCTQCSIESKRSELEAHIKNECPNTIIHCKFQPQGCNTQIKRSELSSHLAQVNHTEFMLKLIDSHKEQLNQMYEFSNLKISLLKKKYKEKSKQCKEELNNQLEQVNQLKKEIEFHKDSIKILFMNTQIKYITVKENNFFYSNTWVISNFLEKLKETSFYSPDINIPPYIFYISCVYEDESKEIFFFLHLNGAKSGTLKVNSKFRFSNPKPGQLFPQFALTNDLEINECGRGVSSNQNNIYYIYSQTDYIFPDGSAKLEFEFEFEKPAIES